MIMNLLESFQRLKNNNLSRRIDDSIGSYMKKTHTNLKEMIFIEERKYFSYFVSHLIDKRKFLHKELSKIFLLE